MSADARGDGEEETEPVAEKTGEDVDDADADDGAEVARAAELAEAAAFLATLGEFETDGTLDGEDDVVAEGPDDDEDDEPGDGRGEEPESDGADGRQDHGRRGHLGFAEDHQHGAGDEDEKEPRQLTGKLDPTACLGPELVDLGEIVVESGHDDPGGGTEEERGQQSAFEVFGRHGGHSTPDRVDARVVSR